MQPTATNEDQKLRTTQMQGYSYSVFSTAAIVIHLIINFGQLTGRVPVFAVTADTEFRGDARSKLFDGVLFKPLTYDKLINALAALHQA